MHPTPSIPQRRLHVALLHLLSPTDASLECIVALLAEVRHWVIATRRTTTPSTTSLASFTCPMSLPSEGGGHDRQPVLPARSRSRAASV